MLAYYSKRSQGEEFEELKKPLKSGMWVSGSNLTVEEINQLIKDYDLAANIVYDVRDHQELPRTEAHLDDLYVFLRLPHLAKSGHVVTAPLLAVVRPDTLISLTQFDSLSLDVIKRVTLPITTTKTDELLLGIIAACVEAYVDLLHHTERSINDTANRLRTHEVNNQDFIHFVVVEDNLTSYRMNLGGIHTVVERLRSGSYSVIDESMNESLDDISLQLKQLLVAVESYKGRVESIRNAYSTIANNKLNQRMKTLTVLTVLITLPNVFYGMYGMNIALPYADAPWAYGAVVGFTVALMLIVYVVAKRFKIF
ncbi:MAG TPA: magnesium transporter CorA family protein [Candidatus Saccharimonadales bacterium]